MYDIILLGGFMEQYKNEEYLKHTIMDQSRHQFIYGYDGIKRKQFLESLTDNYPIALDENAPAAIYLSDIALPKIPVSDSSIDLYKIDLIAREFLYFSIASDILSSAASQVDMDLLNHRIKGLINALNRCFINKDYLPISDFDNLLSALRQSKDFYQKYYMEYYGKGTESLSINDIPLPFMQLDMFIKFLKEALNNSSYFGIIVDKQNSMAVASTKAINDLVGSRINQDISMKVALEPDKWDTYIGASDQLIEYIHDYGTVELDDSESEYLKRIKKNL